MCAEIQANIDNNKKGGIYMPSKEFFDCFYIFGLYAILPVGLIAIQTRDVVILPVYWFIYNFVLIIGMIVY